VRFCFVYFLKLWCSRTASQSAQRDLLATFDYSLGDTPQPVMDELWNALPSLRQLLDYEGGWNHTQNQAWGRLLDAVLGEGHPLSSTCSGS
jgi:hypothetical protein